MYELTHPNLTIEFYDNMLESSLNPYTIISEVKVKPINVNLEVIAEILGLSNSGIILREKKSNENPY